MSLETMSYTPTEPGVSVLQPKDRPSEPIRLQDPRVVLREKLLSYKPHELSSDPDSLEHLKRVKAINTWLYDEVADPGKLDEFLAGNRGVYTPEEAHEVDRLRGEVAEFERSVLTPEAKRERTKIGFRYNMADRSTIGLSKEERAAARVAAFIDGGIEVVSDYDNTITDEAKIHKVDGVKPGHPGGVVADHTLAKYKDQLGFGDAYAGLYPASFQKAAQEFPEAFFENGRTSPLREGAEDFFRYMKDANIPFMFASANLEYTIWGTLSRFPHPDDIRVWSITPDSITAVAKGAVLATEAIQNPDRAIIYMGDGESDKPSLEAQDVTAMYFALEGSRFAQDLEDAGALYFTYNSLTDVSNKMQEIFGIIQSKSASQHASLR